MISPEIAYSTTEPSEKILDTSFQEHYSSLSDDELLHIAGDRRDLREDAALALDAEMVRRGLTHEQARAKKRDELRLDIEEARAHHPKRRESKYFVARMNLRAYLAGLIGLVFLMFLLLGVLHIREEWFVSALAVYVGALVACLAVQTWVRRTLSFWVALSVSCVPEVLISHWVTVNYPSQSNAGIKGTGFLSLAGGYALGGVVFLLLQKLKPAPDHTAQDPRDCNTSRS